MITIGLFAIVAFIFAWKMFRKEYRFERGVFSCIIALIGTFVGGLAAVVISQVSVDSVRWDRTANIELVSLNRSIRMLQRKERIFFNNILWPAIYRVLWQGIPFPYTVRESQKRLLLKLKHQG